MYDQVEPSCNEQPADEGDEKADRAGRWCQNQCEHPQSDAEEQDSQKLLTLRGYDRSLSQLYCQVSSQVPRDSCVLLPD